MPGTVTGIWTKQNSLPSWSSHSTWERETINPINNYIVCQLIIKWLKWNKAEKGIGMHIGTSLLVCFTYANLFYHHPNAYIYLPEMLKEVKEACKSYELLIHSRQRWPLFTFFVCGGFTCLCVFWCMRRYFSNLTYVFFGWKKPYVSWPIQFISSYF